MTHRLVRIVLPALLAAALSIPAQAAKLMIIGDSLSDAYSIPRESGWVQLLDREIDDQHEVINASISGETTAGAVTRIDGLLDTHEPDAVLIILGGNDGLRGLAPGQTLSNLATLVEKAKASGARVALMQIRLPPNLGPVYIERFEAVYSRLAERYDVELWPFFLDDIFQEPGMLQDDGIHPTVEAQPLMLEAVMPRIETLLASAATE